MNLPLSHVVNPALASALLTVSSPAPAQSSTLAAAAGSAAPLREDFAQHFARMARQNQAKPPRQEPAPERQHLATDAPHRPDARFGSPKHIAASPAHQSADKSKSTQQSDDGQPAMAPNAPPIKPHSNHQANDTASAQTPSQGENTGEDQTSVTTEASANTKRSASADAKEAPDTAVKQALPTGQEVAWAALVPEGLKTLQISERLQIITTAEPLPDPQSNARFARSMGFDEQMIQRLFGPLAGNASGAGLSVGATPVLLSTGDAAAGMAPTATFTVSADAAKAMASLSAAQAVSGQALSTVGDLQSLGAHSIHIAEMVEASVATMPQASLTMPSVSTQNMLAMLSAFVPNADSKRLTNDSDSRALETIDLSGLVGDNPGSALNLVSPAANRANPMGNPANTNLAPTSTDMAQAYQDLSDKLSTELAGRMHQQLNEGQWKMKLGLKPSHLGAVDVELEMRDGKLSAVINADNATTQQLLNQGSPRLREALNTLGWTQASVNIGQGHSSSAQSGQGQGQHPGQPHQQLSRGESILGDVAEANPNKTQNTSNALLDIYA